MLSRQQIGIRPVTAQFNSQYEASLFLWTSPREEEMMDYAHLAYEKCVARKLAKNQAIEISLSRLGHFSSITVPRDILDIHHISHIFTPLDYQKQISFITQHRSIDHAQQLSYHFDKTIHFRCTTDGKSILWNLNTRQTSKNGKKINCCIH